MMKRILLLSLIMAMPMLAFSQSKEIKNKYKKYTEEGYFVVDGTNIAVNAVIENIPGDKNDVYIKVKNFFTRNYADANSVLQTDDKEAGVLIGKGHYKDIYVRKILGVTNTVVNTYHILRIDIQDGRLRAICSADFWEVYDGNGVPYSKGKIVDQAPFTNNRLWDKGKQMEAFINLVEAMHATIDVLEGVVKEGGVSMENDDW